MARRDLTDSDKRAFQYFLAAYAAVMRKIGKDLTQHTELSLEQYDVLVTLEYEPDMKLRLSELANRILLSRSGLTRLIDRLEMRGWVRREECPEDRRGAFAVLTPEGQAARRDSWPVLEASMKRHFKDRLHDDEDLEAFARVCRAIAFGIDKTTHPWDTGPTSGAV